MKRKRDIEMWMLLVIVLLTACSDHSGEGSDEKGDCFLDIYVYSPEHPMLTRADVGEIASRSVDEHMVHTLQIWVFKNSNGELVGYLETKPTFLNETNGQEMFQMKVEKTFADHPVNVDVYVVANAGSVGLKKGTEDLTLGANTSRSFLDAAMIGESSFGVGSGTYVANSIVSPVSSVPSEGLPMSGVLKNQSIYGSYPTLRVGTQDAMATVQLTRAVSKLRFVLCQKKEKDNAKKILVSIDKIQLNNGINSNNEDDESTCRIPTESYLMPVEKPSYATYVSAPINYGGVAKDALPKVKDPMVYAYETQSAQDYENLINHAADEDLSRKDANIAWLNDYGTNKEIAGLQAANFSASILAENGLSWPQLKELGLTYLRESDKKLTGTITYKIKERTDTNTSWSAVEAQTKKATFSMADSGDFLRNRSWIVYVFYMDATIYTLTVTNIGMKSWASGGYEEKSVYNW